MPLPRVSWVRCPQLLEAPQPLVADPTRDDAWTIHLEATLRNPAVALQMPEPDSIELTNESPLTQTDVEPEGGASTDQRSVLAGKYMNQIEARISRTWMRPRTAIDADSFDCSVHIEQDRDGTVLSIELIDCNGDLRWQRSLVTAIQRASPLSAPPEPSVFASVLILRFQAKAYQRFVSNESDYEPARPSMPPSTCLHEILRQCRQLTRRTKAIYD